MTSTNEFSELRKFLNQQLDVFEDEVKKAGFPLPQITAPELHPLDDPFYLQSTELYKARERLVGALGMLQACVQSPAEKLMSASFSHHVSSALSLVVKAGVPEVLKELGPGPVSSESLGQKVKVDSDKLLRVLRFLANQNIFSEASEGHFQHNRASLLLLPANPIRSWVSFQTWISLLSSPHFADTLLDPATSSSFSHNDSATCKALDIKDSDAFQWLAEHEPKRVAEFASAMTAFSTVGVNGLISDYPWHEIKSQKVVDVGAGHGAVLLPILKAFPHLSGVVQDRPEVIKLAEKNFETNLPEAIKDNRIEFEAHDFFTPQPRKGDGYVFMMRAIIHDWADDKCIEILKHLAEAMTPSSRLLIIDTVIVPAVIGETSPLPKSLGDGGHLQLQVGQEMLQGVNAKERTATEFATLLEASGLKLEKVYSCRSLHGIVEARLRS